MTNWRALPDRTILSITGPEATDFLQGVITQDVSKLGAGDAAFAALLTPQGKILFDFLLIGTDDGFLIDCHAPAAADLMKRLKLYKLRAKVDIAEAQTLMAAVGGSISPDDVIIYEDPRLAELGKRAIGHSFAEVDDGAYDAERIALGVPEFGSDFQSDDVFLLDVNYDALNAVSYQKGCFVGQEVTSRMKRKSEARRRTYIVELSQNAPAPGAEIMAGDSSLGALTSVSGRFGLAQIRVDRLEKADARTIVCEGASVELRAPGYLAMGASSS